jgi:tRNA(Ile)-lysidine synthase
MVAEICAARAIPCAVLEVSVAPGNVQSEARKARYLALAAWAEERMLSAIATAHHADDQAETLLMRLNRGSGLAGLTGVRESRFMPNSAVSVIRPLLTFRRQELADLAAAGGLDPVQDPSNADERFDRTRVRRALAEAAWLDPVALSRSATLLGEAQQAIEATAETEWLNGVVEEDEGLAYYPSTSARYIAIEVVTAIIGRMGGAARRSEVARLVERLNAGRAGNLAGVVARPTTHQREDKPVAIQKWIFTLEPPRRLH